MLVCGGYLWLVLLQAKLMFSLHSGNRAFVNNDEHEPAAYQDAVEECNGKRSKNKAECWVFID